MLPDVCQHTMSVHMFGMHTFGIYNLCNLLDGSSVQEEHTSEWQAQAQRLKANLD